MNFKGSRTLVAVASLLVGFLQAWDSGALLAGPAAQLLIAIGVALGPLAIVSPVGHGVKMLMLVAAALILMWARMIAPVSLNGLHLGLFVPALYLFFVSRIEHTLPRQSES